MIHPNVFHGLYLLVALVLFSCGKSSSGGGSNNESYAFVLLDSFQVDYPKEIHGAAFQDSLGVFYNFRDGSFTAFDRSGEIVMAKIFPAEGEDALGYVSGLKMKSPSSILVQTLLGEIALLGDSLNLLEKVLLPFDAGTPNLRSNIKSLDIHGDEVFLYYPGRGGRNPLEKGYFKENRILERINLQTGEMVPVFNLAPESKFNQDLYFEEPYLYVAIHETAVYVAFDNEPIIYRYQLGDTDALPTVIPLHAARFLEVSGQPIPLGNIEGVYPGLIEGIFPFESGIAVVYGEGLDKKEVEKLATLSPKYVKSQQKNWLKIYDNEKGWDGEIPIPAKVAALLGFDNPEKEFFALRNEELFGATLDAVTIYRCRIVKLGEGIN